MSRGRDPYRERGNDGEDSRTSVYEEHDLPRNSIGRVIAFGLKHPLLVRVVMYSVVLLFTVGVFFDAVLIMNETGSIPLAEVEIPDDPVDGVLNQTGVYKGRIVVTNMQSVVAVEAGVNESLPRLVVPNASSPNPERFGFNNTSGTRACLSDVSREGWTAYHAKFNNTSGVIVGFGNTSNVSSEYTYLFANNTSRTTFLVGNGYAVPPDSWNMSNKTGVKEVMISAKENRTGLWRCADSVNVTNPSK